MTAEQRDAWRKALAQRAKALRVPRYRRGTVLRLRPGMIRKPPPPPEGTTRDSR